MVKRILLILLLIIVLLVAALSALVLLVNPNHYRGYISQVVKEKTGYELTIQGDLRWHIWPQISILSGPITLTDSGASKPLVSADNMRLDLELWPLFSKQLVAKNVLIKSAVINLTEQSQGSAAEARQQAQTSSTQASTTDKQEQSKAWLFSLQKFELADSTVIVQQRKQNMLSFRNLNAQLEQQDTQHLTLTLDGLVNHNQRNLNYDLKAQLDLSQYPQQAIVHLDKLRYQLQGADLPKSIQGELKATINYQTKPQQLQSDDVDFTMNSNRLRGRFQLELAQKPRISAAFSGDQFDLTPWFSQSTAEAKQATETAKSPVISQANRNELDFLNQFDGELELQLKQLLAKQLQLDNVVLFINNRHGMATLKQLDFDLAGGQVKTKGSANGTAAVANLTLQTNASKIDIGQLAKQFDLKQDLSGILSLNGTVSSSTIDPDRLIRALHGNANIAMQQVRVNNINIEQIIRRAAARLSKTPQEQIEPKNYTTFQQLNAQVALKNGQLNLSSMNALSEVLQVDGHGDVDLIQQRLDLNLMVKLLKQKATKNEILNQIQKLPIPLRIYGEYSQLQYQLDLEKLLGASLKSELKRGLDKLKSRYF